MEQINNWLSVFMQSTQGALTMVISFIPKFIGAFLIFIIGWIIAKILEKVAKKFFELIGINKVSQKSGVENFLVSSGFSGNLSWIFARILFWGIILIFLLPVADILEFNFFADIVNSAIAYIPNVLIALLIVLFGSWAAKVISGMVRGGSVRLGSDYSEILGTLLNITILVVTFIVALAQLKINAAILGNILLIVVGSLAVGLAIAFGLGSQNIIRNVVAGVYIGKSLKPGSIIKTKLIEGKLIEVGTVTSVIETSEKQIIHISNNNLIDNI